MHGETPLDESAAREVAPPPTSRREITALLVILVTLLCVGYGNVVFGGRSLVYTDAHNPMDARSRPENYGPGFVPAQVWSSRNLYPYSNFHDPGGVWWQWEPAAEFLRHGLQRGELPLWDPYVGAGAPALANLTSTWFFPPYLAVVLLGSGALLKNVYFLALLVLAGVTSYLFLRRHGLSTQACLASAVAVMFCGGLGQNVGAFIGQTAALIPLSLLLTRWFLDSPTWRRAACLASGYALIALSSFPPILVAAFSLSGMYAVVFALAGVDRNRTLLRYLAAVIVSVALICFLYLPALAAAHTPQIENTYAGGGLQTIEWSAMGQLLSPVLAGGRKVLMDPPVLGGQFSLPYVGVVVLLLAFLTTSPQRRDAALLCSIVVVASLAIALKLMGVWPVQAVGYLPVLDKIHFSHYFGIPLNILLCLLAGFGVDRLLTEGRPTRRVVLASSMLAVVALYLLFIFLKLGKRTHPFAEQWLERWYWLAALLLLATLLAAFAGQGAMSTRRRGVAYGLVALVALEGILNTYLPRQQRWNVWRHPVPYVQELIRHRELGRVYASGTFNANAASAFDVYTLDSLMTFNNVRIFEFYRRYAAPNTIVFLRSADVLPADPVLDAANIGLVAIYQLRTSQIAEARLRGYHPLWSDDLVQLFSRPTAPRYYFTSQYRVLPAKQALEEVDEHRLTREILLEETPALPPVPNTSGDPAVQAKVGRNRSTLIVDAPRPGFVYCSEAYAPGWKASVNGKPARILPANYAFRAIPVPAGKVSIELSYWPPGLTGGLLASLLGLIGMVVMATRKESSAAAPVLQLGPRLASRTRRRVVWASVIALVPLIAIEADRRYEIADLTLAPGTDPMRTRSDKFYRVEWGEVAMPSKVRTGDILTLRVPLRNIGDEAWPDPITHPRKPLASGSVRLSYRWLAADEDPPRAPYTVRVDLPAELQPGQAIELPMTVRVPSTPGTYRLQFDLVHEFVAWFETRGAAPLVIPVQIESGPGLSSPPAR